MFQRQAEDEVKGGGREGAAERGGAGVKAEGEGGEDAPGHDPVELGANDAGEEDEELSRKSTGGRACGKDREVEITPEWRERERGAES